MKKLVVTLCAVGFMAGAIAHADETLSEKATATGDTAKRKVKHAVNKAKEAVCTEGDVTCAAKKVGHRADETVGTMKDKAKETKAKVD